MSRKKDRNRKNTSVQPVSPQHSFPQSGAQIQADRAGMRAELYAGQIPHPDHLERFEQLQHGATDRFIGMAERQSEHRQLMERRHLTFNGISQILGVVFAGLVVIGGLGAGAYLLYHDKDIAGFSAMFGPLATVGGIFLGVRRSQKREIERKLLAEER